MKYEDRLRKIIRDELIRYIGADAGAAQTTKVPDTTRRPMFLDIDPAKLRDEIFRARSEDPPVVQGPKGLPGEPGPMGLTGIQGPVGDTGCGITDVRWETTSSASSNCIRFSFNICGVWSAWTPYICSVQGPIGLTGIEGPIGRTGPTGPTGSMGPAGPQGLPGATINNYYCSN